ncbi:unnamed protein product [Sphacelaria rigidula]
MIEGRLLQRSAYSALFHRSILVLSNTSDKSAAQHRMGAGSSAVQVLQTIPISFSNRDINKKAKKSKHKTDYSMVQRHTTLPSPAFFRVVYYPYYTVSQTRLTLWLIGSALVKSTVQRLPGAATSSDL